MQDKIPKMYTKSEHQERINAAPKKPRRLSGSRGWSDRLGSVRRSPQAVEQSINSSLELFEGLSPTEMQSVRGYFTVIDVENGRDLGRKGTVCQQFVVVLTGQVAMSFDETPAGILTPGCFFGALPLLDERMDLIRRATATALADSKLAIADPRQFSGLLYSFPALAERIRAVVAQRAIYVASVEKDTQIDHDTLDYPVHVLEDSRE